MTMRPLIAHIGSLRSTLALMALLGAAVFVGQIAEVLGAPALALAMALLALNLVAAIVVHPAFRRQLPLLVAHLALLALVLLAAYGRLASLDGRFELTQGVPGVCVAPRQLLRRTLGHHLAATVAALGAEVDDPVGLGDHVEVVLDHDDRVAGVDQPVQHREQLLDVVHR